MKERFTGEARRAQLIAALEKQAICRSVEGLAAQMADMCEIVEFSDGDKLITQGEQTNDVYLLRAKAEPS